MNISEIFDFVTRYFSDYLTTFLIVLRDPAELKRLLSPGRVSPRLLGFAIIGIFIGSVLQGAIATRPLAPALLNLVIVAVVMWLTYAVLIFALTRILGGSADLVATISVALLVISVAYVIASVAVLVVSIFVDQVDRFFYGAQGLLYAILLPRALLPLHFPEGAPAPRTALYVGVLLLLSAAFAAFGFLFFEATRIPIPPVINPTPTPAAMVPGV